MLRFLHTADLHFGIQYQFLPPEIAKMKKASQRQGFSSLVDYTLEEEIKIFLIAGDLFHSPNPPKEDLHFVKKELQRLKQSGVHTFIISGNHDPYEPDSLWEQAGPWPAQLFNSHQYTSYVLEEFDVQIFGLGFDRNQTSVNQLRSFQEKPETKYSLLLFHGALQSFGREVQQDYPFTEEDVKKLPVQYVALGHYHQYNEVVSTPKLRAIYPGSPEGFTFSKRGTGPRQAVVGTLHKDGRATTEKLPVKALLMENLEVDLNLISLSGLESLLQQEGHTRKLMQLHLTGTPSLEVLAQLPDLQEQFSSLFAFFQVKNEITQLPEGVLGQENTYRGHFYRQMQQRLNQAQDDDERQLVKQAMAVGLAAFEGN